MSEQKRIGIYGGTFSPPHLGHYKALKAFIEQERPCDTLVIPTFLPPHKQLKGDATPDERLAMCRLAFSGLPVTVSDLEIARGGKSYTALTLESLHAKDTTLLFLCGTDMFLSMDTWYQPQTIFSLAEIVYVRRENDIDTGETLAKKADLYRERFGARVREIICDVTEVSSTEIRDAIVNGRDTSAFLNPDVRRYIDQWQLYRK